MSKKFNLRPVAEAEYNDGNLVAVREIVVGVRGSRRNVATLRDRVSEAPFGPLADRLYLAGLASRNPEKGHGYVLLDCVHGTTEPAFRVYQTLWSRWDEVATSGDETQLNNGWEEDIVLGLADLFKWWYDARAGADVLILR